MALGGLKNSQISRDSSRHRLAMRWCVLKLNFLGPGWGHSGATCTSRASGRVAVLGELWPGVRSAGSVGLRGLSRLDSSLGLVHRPRSPWDGKHSSFSLQGLTTSITWGFTRKILLRDGPLPLTLASSLVHRGICEIQLGFFLQRNL